VARTVDVVGNCLAALREGPAGIVGAVVQEWGGNGAATGFGRADLLPAPSAALLNGTLAHSLDFDDTHLPSVLHPSSSVVPAALAAAELFGAAGRRCSRRPPSGSSDLPARYGGLRRGAG